MRYLVLADADCKVLEVRETNNTTSNTYTILAPILDQGVDAFDAGPPDAGDQGVDAFDVGVDAFDAGADAGDQGADTGSAPDSARADQGGGGKDRAAEGVVDSGMATADAGGDPDGFYADNGCSCRAAGGSAAGGGAWLLLLILGFAVRRRRGCMEGRYMEAGRKGGV